MSCFEILGVQQIAIGNLDISRLHGLWVNTLGLHKINDFTSKIDNVYETIHKIGIIELDLMTPLNVNSSPKVHLPALNHIGLWVDGLSDLVEYLELNNIEIISTQGKKIRPGALGYDIAFIHPKNGGQGVLIELIQAPVEIKEALKQIDTLWEKVQKKPA